MRNDEAWTALWVSGYSHSEVQDDLCGRAASAKELQRYLHATSGRTLLQTISVVAADDPKQSPLYYALLRLWVEIAGDSRAAAW